MFAIPGNEMRMQSFSCTQRVKGDRPVTDITESDQPMLTSSDAAHYKTTKASAVSKRDDATAEEMKSPGNGIHSCNLYFVPVLDSYSASDVSFILLFLFLFSFFSVLMSELMKQQT
jgi:hypothetical protein